MNPAIVILAIWSLIGFALATLRQNIHGCPFASSREKTFLVVFLYGPLCWVLMICFFLYDHLIDSY